MANHLIYPLPSPISMADNALAMIGSLLESNSRNMDLYEEDILFSPIKIRVNLCVVRSILNLRTNRSALLVLMLMSCCDEVIQYKTLLLLLAPDAESEVLGKKLVRVYIHEIRKQLDHIGLRDGLKLHRLDGYSISRACKDAIEEKMRLELRKW